MYTHRYLARSLNPDAHLQAEYLIIQQSMSSYVFVIAVHSFYSYDETETYLMSVISGDNVVTYDYNEDGDLTSITNKDGSQTLVRYNENHFVAAIANLDTGSQLTSEISFEFSWNGHLDINIDPLNRTQRIGHDSNGRVVSVTQDNGLPLVAQEFLNSSRLLYGDEVSLI